MKTKPTVILLTTLLFLLLVTALRSTAAAQESVSFGQTGALIWNFPGGIEQYKAAPFASGEIVVGLFRTNVAAAGWLPEMEAVVAQTVDLRGLDGATGDAGVEGLLLRVQPGREWATVERLLTEPGVAFAHPNWLVWAAGEGEATAEAMAEAAAIEASFDVNDPLYATEQWYLQRIHAPRAWALASYASEAKRATIRVAVVDSGVDSSHPDLKPHLLAGKNYLETDEPPFDGYGHGTHVAGVIASMLNNGQGLSGLAPWVELDARKVLNSSGGGTIANVSTAIREAAEDGAQIINLSLEAMTSSPTMEAAVQFAHAEGALLIAAAGNCSPFGTNCPPPVRWPAAYDEVVAVSATNYRNQRASYSAVGPEVEIAAPGGEQSVSTSQQQIYSAWSIDAVTHCDSSSGHFQYLDGGGYCNSSGTSMAASVVSGVAALVWSVDPSRSAEQIRQVLRETAAPLPYPATNVGSGLIDAHAAIRRLLKGALQPSDYQLSYHLPPATTPFSVTVSLQNPSAHSVAWNAQLIQPASWVQFTLTSQYPTSGSIRYGQPAYLTLAISPDALPAGSYHTDLVVNGTRSTGGSVQQIIPIDLLVDNTIYDLYIPSVVALIDNGAGAVNTPTFRWETPNDDGRVVRTLTDQSNIGLTLPFSFPFRDDTFNTLRLYSDGYVIFPADDSGFLATNACPVAADWPQEAIYGWWADLDPSQTGAQVSLFETDDGKFVIEFLDVPSAAGVEPAYVVSFQIVLSLNGRIWLNYLDVPELLGRPAAATVAVEAVDSRFSNRIFCANDTTILGTPPAGHQSFLLRPEDLY